MPELFANQILEDRTVDGRPLVALVVNEHQLCAAAGIVMALGAAGFAVAYFGHRYWMLQVMSAFFGISRSPLGLLAGEAHQACAVTSRRAS